MLEAAVILLKGFFVFCFFVLPPPVIMFVLLVCFLLECFIKQRGSTAPPLTLRFRVSGLWWPRVAYANL